MATLGGHEPGSGPGQVGQDLTVLGTDHGPVRYPDHQVIAGRTVAVRPGPLRAVARLAHRPALEVEPRGHAGMHLEDHVAAAPAVAPVRAAQRREVLTVHGGAA